MLIHRVRKEGSECDGNVYVEMTSREADETPGGWFHVRTTESVGKAPPAVDATITDDRKAQCES